MSLKYRGEIITPTDQANLSVQFKDESGNPIDTDSYPKVSLIQPTGLVYLAPTSVGVTKIDIGKYYYQFTAPINAELGVWRDVWTGYINGFKVEAEFQFIVNTTQVPAMNTDGYVALGDDPGLSYSQDEIRNINKLLKSLKARLNSSGKSKAYDKFGNVVYVDCSIFSIDMLTTFLATILMDFNQVPFFTTYTFADSNFVNQFGEILVEGATIYALASKSLIERGREFQVSDNGINFNMPTVSELMMSQYSSLLTAYNEKLKFIKNSLRPAPIGLGVLSLTGGSNPAIARLRHRRAGRLI